MGETPGWARPGDDDDPSRSGGSSSGQDPYFTGSTGEPSPPAGPPQYGQPQYGQPQYGQPQYGQPQYGQPGWESVPGYAPPSSFGVPPGLKPGIIPLRPLGVGEILDGAFTTMRRNPAATLGLAAIVTAFAQLVQIVLIVAVAQTDWGIEASAVVAVIGAVVAFFFREVLSGALTFVVGDAVLGKKTTMGDALRRVRPRILPLYGVVLLTILTAIVIAIPGIVLAAIAAAAGVPALTVIFILADVGVVIYVMVLLSLAAPALVLEGQSPVAAMRRSAGLVRGSWWRVLGITLLVSIVSAIIGGIVGLPFSIAGQSLSSGVSPGYTLHPAGLFLTALGGIISGTVSYPITSGALAILYIDRRMRREGLDVTLARSVQGGGPTG